MAVTNVDNQSVELKEKLKRIYNRTQPHLSNGICPTREVLAPTLDRWGMLCLFNLAYYETMRFTELRKRIPGISPRMLTVTLKKLESNGFARRRVYPEAPPRVEYTLTEFGLELSRRLSDLTDWFIQRYDQQASNA